MVVWTLTGMWHGAAWNFVAWGVYYGVILVMEKYVWGASVEQLPKPVQHIYAGAVILVGWVFFFSPSLGYALRYLWAMIGGGSGIADAQGAFLLFTHWLLFVIAAVGSTAYGRKLLNNAVRFSANRTVRMTVGAVLYIGIFFLSVAFLVTDTFTRLEKALQITHQKELSVPESPVMSSIFFSMVTTVRMRYAR